MNKEKNVKPQAVFDSWACFLVSAYIDLMSGKLSKCVDYLEVNALKQDWRE